MKNLLLITLFILPFFSGASVIDQTALAEISTNIQNAYSPDMLINYAVQAGKIKDKNSINLFEQILEKCNELDSNYSNNKFGNRINVARAYAMFYLAKLSKKNLSAKRLIEDNFKLNRAICTALHKAKYQNLYKLIDSEISRLFSKYNSLINDSELALEVARQHPGVKFILESYKTEKIVEPKLFDAMLDFAYFAGAIRSYKYFALCKKALDHAGSFFWSKPIYRSILRIKTSNYNKFIFFKKELINKRNTEFDECAWDFNHPETILFSIKNISAEAYLIFAIWNLKKIDLNQKIMLIIPSLKSSSFSARAMTVDCLASNPDTFSLIEKKINKNDKNLMKFLELKRQK